MPTRELVSRDRRRLALGAAAIDYVLVRRRGRRGVGLKVDESGLTVSAPVSMPLARIETLVRDSERWVLGKIDEWRARRVPPVSWAEGALLPFRGGWLSLRIAAGPRAHAESGGGELRVSVRGGSEAAVPRAVIAWYKREALVRLGERVRELALRAGLAPPRLLLSSAQKAAEWFMCRRCASSWQIT